MSDVVIRPVEVEPRPNYRLKLRYSNGAAGEVDLSHLVGMGVFKEWNDKSNFLKVRITSYGALAWGSEIEICPDALYARLPGRSLSELMQKEPAPVLRA